MKKDIKLVLPCKKLLEEYRAFYIEDLTLSPNTEKMLSDPEKILQKTHDYHLGKNLPEGYVPATELWCVEDKTLIGVINIRHQLSDSLLNYGGNIGYCIRPNKRWQGYGKAMLALALKYVKKELNFKKVLITCDDDNLASAGVIEANGGILARKIEREELTPIRCYWINLDDYIIETERLILRETNQNDFENLKSVIGDPINMKYYPAPYNDDGVNRWLNWCIASYARRGFGLWAVIIKETGEYIGDCGLSMQNIDGNLVPEIGYHLKLSQHQKGYGYEAASAVRDYIFTMYNFDKLYSYMTASNVASYSLALKNGMSFEKEYIDEGIPHKVYSIDRKTWTKIKRG